MGSEMCIRDRGCIYSPGLPAVVQRLDSLPYRVAEVRAPTCTGMDDGYIQLEIPPNFRERTTIIWREHQTGNTFRGGSGSHSFTLQFTLCRADGTAIIPEPEKENFTWVPVNDSVLCSGNRVSYTFDSDYTYYWFTDQEPAGQGSDITLPVPAEIALVIEDSRGCRQEDAWRIDTAELHYDLDFLLAGEGVINSPVTAADISWPLPDSIKWVIDSTHLTASRLTENQVQLLYSEPGTYKLQAYIYAGGCQVLIEKYCRIFGSKDSLTYPIPASQATVLESMKVAPSPNTGDFKVYMQYKQLMRGMIAIYDSRGRIIYQRGLNPQFYSDIEEFELENAPSGQYMLVYRAVNGETHWQNFIIIN